MERESLKLLELFNLSKKNEVEKYCKNLVITSEDFTEVLLGGRAGVLEPYRYACHFFENTPEQLLPKDGELAAMCINGAGKLERPALKTLRKTMQIFCDRRLLATHLFYVPSQKYWHLFYSDQRDFEDHRNHWKQGGPHIHYSSDLFTNESLEIIWSRVTSEKPTLPPAIHIRYRRPSQ